MAGRTVYGYERSPSSHDEDVQDGTPEIEKSWARDKSTIDTLMRMLQRLKDNNGRADVTDLWEKDMLSTYVRQYFTSMASLTRRSADHPS
jgi:hypothetical protein